MENRKEEKELDLDQLDKVAGGGHSRPDAQKALTCSLCKATFLNFSDLEKHRREKHFLIENDHTVFNRF